MLLSDRIAPTRMRSRFVARAAIGLTCELVRKPAGDHPELLLEPCGAPAQLLADQRQTDQLDQRCLEELAGLVARVRCEGGIMIGAGGSHAHCPYGVSQPVAARMDAGVARVLAVRIDALTPFESQHVPAVLHNKPRR